MVLAAGFGTRLAPYTDHTPKPLVPFFDVPLIDYTLQRLLDAGITRIVVNTHHLADTMEAHLRAFHRRVGRRRPFDLHISREDAILGTGGAIARARHHFRSGPVLVINSDIYSGFDLKSLLDTHRKSAGAATLLIHSGEGLDHLRSTTVADDGTVVAIEKADPSAKERGVFSGTYVLEPSVYNLLPDEKCSVVTAGLHRAMAQRQVVNAVKTDFVWHDLGTWEAVLQASMAVLNAPGIDGPYRDVFRLSPGRFVLTSGSDSVAAPSYLGPGARVEGRAGPHCVVGRGALVPAGICVARSVVMPDVTVQRDTHEQVSFRPS